MERVSEYFLSLSLESRARYTAKVTNAGLKSDPYAIHSEYWVAEPEKVPNVAWGDMFMFMIATPSPYTREEIKAWKGMIDGNSFVKAGWVHEMKAHLFKHGDETRWLIIGKVKHSQRMSATPLTPWIICQETGEILSTHCTCMAGLGEACSHIAVIISCVIRASQLQDRSGVTACTSQRCTWLPTTRDVTPAHVCEIKFKSSSSKPRKAPLINPPTKDELDAFYDILNISEEKPAILKITPPYSQQFIPLSLAPSISQLYDPDALELTYLELFSKCETVVKTLQVTRNEITRVEQVTRGQAANRLWFHFREGRITGSVFRAAVHTNPCMSSQSLKICYPWSTKSTRWGCSHEKDAVEAYQQQTPLHHVNLVIAEAGLFISQERPYIGASPDRIVSCDCCGKGVLEVKFPFCIKEGLQDTPPPGLCMQKDENNKWTLKHEHAYYYQVQAQLNI